MFFPALRWLLHTYFFEVRGWAHKAACVVAQCRRQHADACRRACTLRNLETHRKLMPRSHMLLLAASVQAPTAANAADAGWQASARQAAGVGVASREAVRVPLEGTQAHKPITLFPRCAAATLAQFHCFKRAWPLHGLVGGNDNLNCSVQVVRMQQMLEGLQIARPLLVGSHMQLKRAWS